jgi:hypothetical protein
MLHGTFPPSLVRPFCSLLFVGEKQTPTEVIGQTFGEQYGSWSFFPGPIETQQKYYAKEMGEGLYQRFFAFADQLIKRDELLHLKVLAMKTEQKNQERGRRLLNIDPGFVALEQMVLISTKPYAHRLYAGQDPATGHLWLELSYTAYQKTFAPTPWCYPDYADQDVCKLFWSQRPKAK